jgi:hypothetical protein
MTRKTMKNILRKMPDDENVFFTAVSFCLFETTMFHASLRQLISEYLKFLMEPQNKTLPETSRILTEVRLLHHIDTDPREALMIFMDQVQWPALKPKESTADQMLQTSYFTATVIVLIFNDSIQVAHWSFQEEAQWRVPTILHAMVAEWAGRRHPQFRTADIRQLKTADIRQIIPSDNVQTQQERSIPTQEKLLEQPYSCCIVHDTSRLESGWALVSTTKRSIHGKSEAEQRDDLEQGLAKQPIEIDYGSAMLAHHASPP